MHVMQLQQSTSPQLTEPYYVGMLRNNQQQLHDIVIKHAGEQCLPQLASVVTA